MSYPNSPSPLWYPNFSKSGALDFSTDLVAHDHALFVFVEEIDTHEHIEKGDDVSFLAFVLSGVPTIKFVQVEEEFGICNPNNPDDRALRKDNLNKYFGEPGSIWNLHGDSNNETASQWLSYLLQPSTWHIVLIGNEEKHGIPIAREIEDGERADDREPAGKIVGIAPVHPYYVFRLEEIFSLNHLPGEDFDLEGKGRPVDYPPSPFTPSEHREIPTVLQHFSRTTLSKRNSMISSLNGKRNK